MAFTQWLVLLRVKRLSLQINLTDSTDEASVVPAVAQRLQETVARINLKVTAVALGTKHLFIVALAVRLSLLHVEGLIPDGQLAGGAEETLHMIGHLQGMHDLPGDDLLAFGTVG